MCRVAVGGTCVLTGDHIVTAAEAESGSVDNTASAQSDQVTTPVTDSVSTPVPPVPSLDIVKSDPVNADEDGNGLVSVGDTLTYTVTATNTGNIAQSAVVVSDPLLTPSTITCNAVAVDASCVLTGAYVVRQSDIDTGEIVNTASVVSNDLPTPLPSNTVTLPLEQQPALAIEKSSADTEFTQAGDQLTYAYLVTNAGNVTLTTPVTVSDDKIANEAVQPCRLRVLRPTPPLLVEVYTRLHRLMWMLGL